MLTDNTSELTIFLEKADNLYARCLSVPNYPNYSQIQQVPYTSHDIVAAGPNPTKVLDGLC